jgi:predicted DCC family thiol-disulfide oxidoreductase YuxK
MIIIFDNNCKFCTSFANWAKNKNSKFQTQPVRSKEARQLLKEKGIQFINLQTVYYIQEDVYTKSKAVLKILNESKTIYKYLYVFRIFPKRITDWLYDIFAKHRHKF